METNLNGNVKKVEFRLKLNNNIIVAREFVVKNFNKSSIKSENLKNCIEGFIFDIKANLKQKTQDYLYDNYNPWEDDLLLRNQKSVRNMDEFYLFELLVDNEVVYQTIFDAWVYPFAVKNSVDVREKLQEFINTMREVCSTKEKELKLVYER